MKGLCLVITRHGYLSLIMSTVSTSVRKQIQLKICFVINKNKKGTPSYKMNLNTTIVKSQWCAINYHQHYFHLFPRPVESPKLQVALSSCCTMFLLLFLCLLNSQKWKFLKFNKAGLGKQFSQKQCSVRSYLTTWWPMLTTIYEKGNT